MSIGFVPFASLTRPSPDMLVIGFQEIVPLTAQQIVQTDPEKRCFCTLGLKTNYLNDPFRRTWENRILDNLDRRPNKKCEYVLLRSEQVALFMSIFQLQFLTSWYSSLGQLCSYLLKVT
jgi:hypothetical protein